MSEPCVRPAFCHWRNRRRAVDCDAFGGIYRASASGVESDQRVFEVVVRESKR